ncbi:MAG: YibE/F family protein [Oscillospiraceae bacterium]|nr:YibE/F family protein [Oscillospiraceae bacterium]
MKLLKNTTFQQAVSVIVSVILLIIASLFCRYKPELATDSELQHAVVNEVIATTQEPSVNNKEAKVVIFSATIKTGEHKGETFKMTQLLDEMSPPVPKAVEPGDRILVAYTQSEHHGTSAISGWTYAGVNHSVGVVLLVGAFLIMILVIGRGKGISTIVSLIITMIAVLWIYIPALLLGYNIYLITVLITLFVIISTLCTLNGWNKKTLCSIIGNAGGILATGVLAFFVNGAFGVTGVINQDYLFLTMLEGGVSIDLKALIWGGILIGSLGAVMDVSMSLASAMQELSEQMYEPSFKKLVISGFNIGRDAIGTMTNTLILAYVGGSMATILLFAAYTSDFVVLLNYEMLLVEIIQAIVGSIGILLAVPITVFFSAWIFLKNPKKQTQE